MCRYCRIVAADLLAVLATDPEQAAVILDLGALPLLSALLNLQHSPGVCFSSIMPSYAEICWFCQHSSPACIMFWCMSGMVCTALILLVSADA